jgi:hypothetical protein
MTPTLKLRSLLVTALMRTPPTRQQLAAVEVEPSAQRRELSEHGAKPRTSNAGLNCVMATSV